MNWRLVGEAAGKFGGGHVRDGVVLRGGAVYAVTERIRLDGAVGAGLSRRSSDVLLTVGLTIGLSLGCCREATHDLPAPGKLCGRPRGC